MAKTTTQQNNARALAKAPATAKAPPTPERQFPALIEQLKTQVALALPRHLNAERMARIALTEYRKNPKLALCTPTSVFASVIMAAQLGLELGVQGQAYLVPYWDNKLGKSICQCIPGWRGLIDLAQRSGRAAAWTGAVFNGDEFEYEFGSSPFVHHIPKGEEDPQALAFVYAVGRVRGSEFPQIDVWPIAKIWKHRDRFNKVGDLHYSYRHPEMYARKIPLLQVLKYLPSSIELSTATALENAAQTSGQRLDIDQAIAGTFDLETGEVMPEPEADNRRTDSQTQALKEQIRAGTSAPAQGEAEKGAEQKQESTVVSTQQPTAAAEQAASAPAPKFTKETAIARIKSCKTQEDLKAARAEIWPDFAIRGGVPIDLEARLNDRAEALRQGEL